MASTGCVVSEVDSFRNVVFDLHEARQARHVNQPPESVNVPIILGRQFMIDDRPLVVATFDQCTVLPQIYT